MKLSACLSATLAGLVVACSKPAPPPAAPPPAPKLVYGLALPWGPDVAIQRARTTSAYLAKTLGAEVEPRLFGYEDLAKALDDGTVDIAFIPPLAYVKASQTGKVTALRRAKHVNQVEYRAVLFTRKDSPVNGIDDLKGKDVAWVREGSASGNLFPRAWLIEHQHDPATLFASQKFLANHSDVCDAVYTGKAWAGASYTNATDGDVTKATVDGCQPMLGDRVSELKAVFITDPIPNDVVAVRANLPQPLVARLGQVLDHLADTDEGKAVLKDGFASDGFEAVTDANFAAVRHAVEVVTPKAEAGE